MYNSGKTAVEITCCGACDCATYPFICLRTGAAARPPNVTLTPTARRFSNAGLANRIGRRR
jgi:hypothetical protein